MSVKLKQSMRVQLSKPFLVMRKIMEGETSPLIYEVVSQHDTDLDALTELQRLIREGDQGWFMISRLSLLWSPLPE